MRCLERFSSLASQASGISILHRVLLPPLQQQQQQWLRREQQQQRPASTNCMSREWDRWGAALQPDENKTAVDDVVFPSHPHCLQAEQDAWAAALECSPSQPEQPPPAVAAVPAAATCNDPDDPQHSKTSAVIELGSHSTRLLLCSGGQELARLCEDTHLGAAAAAGPVLGAPTLPTAGVTATLAVLRRYQQVIQQHPGCRLSVIATAAVRAAQQAGSFLAEVEQLLGAPVQVLTGKEEAALSFPGAASAAAPLNISHCYVVDVGGRSTEVAWGSCSGAPEWCTSVCLGCVSLQAGGSSPGASGHRDPAGGAEGPESFAAQVDEFAGLVAAAKQVLQASELLVQQSQALLQQQQHQQQPRQKQQEQRPQPQQQQQQATVIGTGGTITTVSAVLQQLPSYERSRVQGSWVEQEQLQQLGVELCNESAQHRLCQRLPWVTPQRAATLSAGCAICCACMEVLGVQRVLVSDSDLLDGAMQQLSG